MNKDIRIPEGYNGMMIIYYKDNVAKATSFFGESSEVIDMRKMVEEAIEKLQMGLEIKEDLNGHKNND